MTEAVYGTGKELKHAPRNSNSEYRKGWWAQQKSKPITDNPNNVLRSPWSHTQWGLG